MRTKYDLIIGLGTVCSCSQCLRYAKLQHLSFPYDWVSHVFGGDLTSLSSTGDLRSRVDVICNDFANWFDIGDFTKIGSDALNGHDRYFNTRFGLILFHDFPLGVPLDRAFPSVREKYRRRIERLLSLLRTAKRVLVVRLDQPGLAAVTPSEDGRYAVERLSRKFPRARFDLVLLRHADGVPAAAPREEHPCDGVTAFAFDYHSVNPDAMPLSPNYSAVATFLRQRYRVKDYRTLGERFARLKKSFGRRMRRLRAKLTSRTCKKDSP